MKITIYEWAFHFFTDFDIMLLFQLFSYVIGLQRVVGAKTHICLRKLLMRREKDMTKEPLASFRSKMFFFLFWPVEVRTENGMNILVSK